MLLELTIELQEAIVDALLVDDHLHDHGEAAINLICSCKALCVVAGRSFRQKKGLEFLAETRVSVHVTGTMTILSSCVMGQLAPTDIVRLTLAESKRGVVDAVALPRDLFPADGALFKELALSVAMFRNEDFFLMDDDWHEQDPWPTSVSLELLARYYYHRNGSGLPQSGATAGVPFFVPHGLRRHDSNPRDIELTFSHAPCVFKPSANVSTSESIYQLDDGFELWGVSWDEKCYHRKDAELDPEVNDAYGWCVHLVWDHRTMRLLIACELNRMCSVKTQRLRTVRRLRSKILGLDAKNVK